MDQSGLKVEKKDMNHTGMIPCEPGCVSVGYAIIFIRELFGERKRDVLINSFAGFGVSLILTVVNARPYPFADLY
jgi:hypothetical protein